MRKRIAILLMIACLLAGTALAEEAIVTNPNPNPNPKDRLNLRTSPDKTAASLARYYSGTHVKILEQTNADWAKVRVGYLDSGFLEGYMMRSYLVSPYTEVKSQNQLLRCTAPGGFTLNVRPEASAPRVTHASGGEIQFTVTDIITVLGDLESGWNHVSATVYEPENPRAYDNGRAPYTGFVRLSDMQLLEDSGGVTTQAVIYYDDNATHPFSQAEMDAAASVILSYFDEAYEGCVLEMLYYVEADSDEIIAFQYDLAPGGSPNHIVFFSNYYVEEGNDSGLETGRMYTGWMWFLVRESPESPWVLDNWGLY